LGVCIPYVYVKFTCKKRYALLKKMPSSNSSISISDFRMGLFLQKRGVLASISLKPSLKPAYCSADVQQSNELMSPSKSDPMQMRPAASLTGMPALEATLRI